MDLSVIYIDSGKDSKYYFTLLRSIIKDFQGLNEKYQNLMLILANRDKFQDGTINEKLGQFFSVERLTIVSMEKVASSGSIDNKGYISIVLDKFSLLPEWEQQLALKHECGHLLLHCARAIQGFKRIPFRQAFCAHRIPCLRLKACVNS